MGKRRRTGWFTNNWKSIAYWLVAAAVWGGLIAGDVFSLSLPAQAVAFVGALLGGLGASAAVASAVVAVGIVVLPALIIYAFLTAWYNSIEDSDLARMKVVLDWGRLGCVLLPMAAVLVVATAPVTWPLLLTMALAPFAFMLLRAIPAVIGWALHVEDPAKNLCDAARNGDNVKVRTLIASESYATISDEMKMEACRLAIENRKDADSSQNHAGVVVSLLTQGGVSVNGVSDGEPLLILWIRHCQHFYGEIDAVFKTFKDKGVDLNAAITYDTYALTARTYVNAWDESPLKTKVLGLLGASRPASPVADVSAGTQVDSGDGVKFSAEVDTAATAPEPAVVPPVSPAGELSDEDLDDGPEPATIESAPAPAEVPPVSPAGELSDEDLDDGPEPVAIESAPAALPAVADPVEDVTVAIPVKDPAKDLCDAARNGDNGKVLTLIGSESYATISDEMKLGACRLAIENRKDANPSQNHAGVVVSLLAQGGVSVNARIDGRPLLILWMKHCKHFQDDEIDAIFRTFKDKDVDLSATFTCDSVALTAWDFANALDESPVKTKVLGLLGDSMPASSVPASTQADFGDGVKFSAEVDAAATASAPDSEALPAISDPAKEYIVAIYVDRHKGQPEACVAALRTQCTPEIITKALASAVSSHLNPISLQQVQILLDAGADVDEETIGIAGWSGEWSVWQNVNDREGCPEDVKALINKHHHQNALGRAVLSADAEAIVEAVKAGATLDVFSQPYITATLLRVLKNQHGNPHFRGQAVDMLLPLADVSAYIVEDPRHEVSGRDDPVQGDTVLHLLVRHNYHLKIAALEVADTEKCNSENETALHLAFRLRHYACVKVLHKVGADLAAVPEDLKSEMLYDILLSRKTKTDWAFVERLLDSGADINVDIPQSPPIWAFVERLLDSGADINVDIPQSPPIWAFVESGADINVDIPQSPPIWHMGVRHHNAALLEFLVERFPQYREKVSKGRGQTALQEALAMRRPNPRVVLALCGRDRQYLAEHSTEAERTSALLRMVWDPGVYDQHLFDAFCMFLNADVDMSAADVEGNTLLHLTARFCTDVTCKFDFLTPLLVLKSKPDAFRENESGQTPLAYARQSRYAAQLEPLIAYVEVAYIRDLEKAKPQKLHLLEFDETLSDESWARIVLTAVQHQHRIAERLITQHFDCLEKLEPEDYQVVYQAHKTRIDEVKRRTAAVAPSVVDHGVFKDPGVGGADADQPKPQV